MDKKSTVIIAVIFIVALMGFVYISFQKPTLVTEDRIDNMASTSEWVNTPAEEQGELLITPKTVITAKHAYQNGIHTIVGEIPLPTSCHILEANSSVSADKKQVFVVLTSSIKTSDSCAQSLTPARFKITVKAEKNAKVLATLNGQDVTLNLIEAGPDENIDNFELYIKG